MLILSIDSSLVYTWGVKRLIAGSSEAANSKRGSGNPSSLPASLAKVRPFAAVAGVAYDEHMLSFVGYHTKDVVDADGTIFKAPIP